ncbi:MAG: flagellar basal body P-ring formation protein FlgA [Nitrospirae bacterium]|nr:flagellar basal body P-ring formation protein FlgA [Nitrospirota bacterium]
MGVTMARRHSGLAVLCVLLMAWPVQAKSGEERKPGQVEPSASQAQRSVRQATKGKAPAVQPVVQKAIQPVTQEVTVEQIRRTLLHYVERLFDGKVSEVQVQVLHPQEPVTVPFGSLDARVAARGLDEGLGRRMFQVTLAVDGKPAETLRVMAEVTATAEVVTAARYIKPEETIQAEDLTLAKVQLPGLAHDFITDLDAVVGKRAIKSIRPDAPIKTSALSLPFAVKRGDQVTIEVKHGGLLVQASGTTKMGGQVGQFVTVTNSDSGKEVRGKVMGPGVVRIGF